MPRRSMLGARWREHRRAALIVAALAGVLAVTGSLAAMLTHTGSAQPQSSRVAPASALSGPSAPPSSTSAPSSAAPDVAYWDAVPPVKPLVSAAYPAITAAARSDPGTYVQAFVTELFTRDYRGTSRDQLLGWVQSEDAPLRSPHYPAEDWSKVLVDSLTDLTWDDALETPIPAPGAWLTLAAQHGWQTASDVRVGLDPIWQQYIADGNQPPDPLATARDVTATVTLHTLLSRHPFTTRFTISIVVQLGSSPHGGGYAAAVTNNYISRAVS